MKTLTRLQCKMIRLVASAQEYKTTKEDSKLKGKKYLTYQLNGIRFIMNEEESFNTLHAAGQLATVDLEETEEPTVDATGKKTGTKSRIAILNWLSHEDVIADNAFENTMKLTNAKVDATIAVYQRSAVAEYEALVD